MNKCLFSLACASTIFFAACSKSDSAAPVTNFQPVSAGSFWKYQTLTGTNTMTSTSRDTTISGKVYHVYTNTGGANSYYNHTGSDYFLYGSLAGNITSPVDLLYLKDNLAPGGTWEVPISVTPPGSTTPYNGKIKFTIGVKDSSMTVLSKSYTGVTRVKIEVIISTFLGDQNVGGGNSYHANNVGNISSVISISNPLNQQTINSRQDLMDYLIQ